MNSSLSQDMSSFLDLSQAEKHCCEYEEKYNSTFRELSELRTLSRSMRNHNNELTINNKGYEEEIRTLKELLLDKRLMVKKLNEDLKAMDDEISRLEATNHLLSIDKQQQKDSLQQLEKIIQEVQTQKDSIQFKLKQQQIDNQKWKKMYQRECQRENIQKQQFTSIITGSLSHQIENITNQFAENHFQSPINTKAKQPHPQTLNSSADFQNHIQTIIQQKFNQLSQLNLKSKQQVSKIQSRNTELTSQIQKAHILVEKYEDQLKTLTNSFQDNQNQRLSEQTHFKSKMSEKLANQSKLSQKMFNFLKIYFLTDCDFQLKENFTRFQIEILLKEVEKQSQQRYEEIRKSTLQNQELKLRKIYKQNLQEEYELIQLKFQTLEREFKNLVEDNCRLIKFNNLSEYKVKRNLYSQHLKNGRAMQCNKENNDLFNT